MAINADKPTRWKTDIAQSVDLFNGWFMQFAPTAYRETRVKTTDHVREALQLTDDLRSIAATTLTANPSVLPVLRMSTAPPLARDRLVGLAHASKNLVLSMEERRRLPPRMAKEALNQDLKSICKILMKLIDKEIFPWLEERHTPTDEERYRASTIVADRLCGAVADPIVRNAQEQRQLALIHDFLTKRGYRQQQPSSGEELREMEPGTFAFRVNVPVVTARKVNIPVDVVVQPKRPRRNGMPILLEAKSAGDFTNPNKRRKEEATKIHQLKETYGDHASLVLFLCGYFDSGYLGYEAAEGIDWIWEHRIRDLLKLGI